LLTGCGKVNNTSDAGPADAGIDADLSGSATVVTEAVLTGTPGSKAGNIDVVSHLPNNMILATATTDANGSATIKVYPGGSVTAIYTHTVDMGADLITWAGVKPGDTLTFGSRQILPPGPSMSLGTQTLQWPALGGVTQFQATTACGTTSTAVATATSMIQSESSACHKEPMDILFRAFNGSTLVAYGFRSNVAFASGGTVTLGAWTTTIPNVTINVTGLPPEIDSVSGSFATIFNTDSALFFGSYSGTPTGGAFTKTIPFHATGERTFGQLLLNRIGFEPMRLFDSFSTNTLTQTVATPTFPTWLQGETNVSSALRRAEWFIVPEASTTSTTTGEILAISWSHQISGVYHSSQWNVIMPPGQTSFDLPPMPPALSDHQPAPADFIGGSTTVFEIPSIPSYDMLRTLRSANIMCLACAVRAGDIQRAVLTQSFAGFF
jgi:hypothetical protein